METDRQTDRASHWKTAVFDSGENFSGQFAMLEQPPSFVKNIYGQTEICPQTGREHRQIHVECHRQVRLSALTGWIKHTKWFAVLGKQHIENSIKYCSKKESAVEGTQFVKTNTDKYLTIDEIMFMAAKCVYNTFDLKTFTFGGATSQLVEHNPKIVNKLVNPVLKASWENWKYVFISKVAEYCEETSGSFIIEDPPTEGFDECQIE